MAQTKDLARVASKWAENAGKAGNSYVEGVQNPKADWATATAAANDNYKAGVTAAANANRFASGVRRAGTQKQQNAALQKGAPRYATGVQLAQPDYQAAMEPVLNTIRAVQLPPRKPKGDPANILRVSAITTALHANKLGGAK